MMTIKPMTSIKQGSLARRFGTLLVPLGILVLLLGGVAANSGLRQMLAQAVERIDLGGGGGFAGAVVCDFGVHGGGAGFAAGGVVLR